MRSLFTIILLILSWSPFFAQDQSPNIILILADDLGIDVLDGFGIDGDKPHTPTIDSLRASGIAFTNCWAAPQCSPTRAAILSGKYGINTGVMKPPGPLELEHTSIFTRIKETSEIDYNMSVIGKWHVGGNTNLDHPAEHGVDHFEGFLNANVEDYYEWTKVVNGVSEEVTEYATTHLTDAAIDWVGVQEQPWFLWLAHAAPHSPFQAPPVDLHLTEAVDDRTTYFAMVEAMDVEIKRLINSIDSKTLENTIIIFIGDNGTPRVANTFFPRGHIKSSIYEGGVRVPMILSGKNISRIGETEAGLVQVTDLHATILELIGIQLPGGIYNSLSIKPLLSEGGQTLRDINYVDYLDDGVLVWATRTDRYKLIEDEAGNQEFYDIIEDIKEENNLVSSLTTEQLAIKEMLASEAVIIRSGWSCNDGIQNGTETSIDACDYECDIVDVLSKENIGCCDEPTYSNAYLEFIEGSERFIYTNGYPNHDFCFTSDRIPEPNFKLYGVDLNPQLTGEETYVVSEDGMPTRFFGVAKNGVIFMPSPGLPFVFENTSTGEYNWDWPYEPTTNQGPDRGQVSLDCSTAHTNGNGYHYHGNMFEYLETIEPGSTTTSEIPATPIHIGWASDGFPIVYRFGPDKDGNMKELLPSFQLRSGIRPGDGISEPCGPYTGKYTRDFEYISGKGDLNQCNGIEAELKINTGSEVETFNFYYVITSDFPELPKCLLGNVSTDFSNRAASLQGKDEDNDGFIERFDCDDNNASINPGAVEITDNEIDENCDGVLTGFVDLETQGFLIGPNPNNGSFWVETPTRENFEITLFTLSGKLVRKISGNGHVDIQDMETGTYTLMINKANQMIGTTKIIVQ